jgi:hypothetical protein
MSTSPWSASATSGLAVLRRYGAPWPKPNRARLPKERRLRSSRQKTDEGRRQLEAAGRDAIGGAGVVNVPRGCGHTRGCAATQGEQHACGQGWDNHVALHTFPPISSDPSRTILTPVSGLCGLVLRIKASSAATQLEHGVGDRQSQAARRPFAHRSRPLPHINQN